MNRSVPDFIVVGLGNPGEEYEDTRHNVGFRAVDRLAETSDTHIRRQEYLALTASLRVGRSEVLVMKPQTYMNRSGESLAAVLSEVRVPIERVVVLYDDVDLDLGRVRVRPNGGTGGHRGVESIVGETGETDFVRIRMGVGRPEQGQDMIEHVLGRFSSGQADGVGTLVDRALDATRLVMSDGVVAAMQAVNGLPAV